MNTITQDNKPQVAEIVAQVLADEQNFASENRSDHREPLVMPAKIHQANFEFALAGFTRNISSQGVCLITPQPFRAGSKVTIDLSGDATQIERSASCCWSAKFGHAYWVSGWHMETELPVGRLLKEEYQIEPELRSNDRFKTAIPVNINIANSSDRIQGFTRNLSSDGISLVSKLATEPGQIATLEIVRFNGDSTGIQSQCLWSKRYGKKHWVSGWTF